MRNGTAAGGLFARLADLDQLVAPYKMQQGLPNRANSHSVHTPADALPLCCSGFKNL